MKVSEKCSLSSLRVALGGGKFTAVESEGRIQMIKMVFWNLTHRQKSERKSRKNKKIILSGSLEDVDQQSEEIKAERKKKRYV